MPKLRAHAEESRSAKCGVCACRARGAGGARRLTTALPDIHVVTDGIESAAARAKSVAGEKSVLVHGTRTIQQCLIAGLDDIHIGLAEGLLREGVPLFDHVARTPLLLGSDSRRR